MKVHFSPEQEAQLSQIAAHAGTNAEGVVKRAALRFVEQTTNFRDGVRAGVAQADRGELVEDDEVLGWLRLQERR